MNNMADPKGSDDVSIGIDVGGTFTDFVVVDQKTDKLYLHKEPSTPEDPSLAVERGLNTLIQDGTVRSGEISRIVHGTTIGLNAIIQRKGAPLALVVSNGNRDILEIARGRMASPYDIYAVKEEPLVARDMVFECSARATATGEIDEFPDTVELDEIAERVRESGVSAIAITILNAYTNPDVERNLALELKKRLPEILITNSTDLWPEMREYERALIATLNSYINPLMDTYLGKLKDRISSSGTGASVFITSSNGGSLTIDSANDRPIETILSGPASGVVAAASLSRDIKVDKVITVDMGGTSADMSISESGTPETTTLTHIGDFPLVMPVVSVSAIGAGGGSIIWVDKEGLLKVGPKSSGADPGPVCYGRGGLEPTITDCYLALGYIDEKRFLDGKMELDKAAAIQALEKIGEKIGLEGDDLAQRTAESALMVTTAKMATELFKGLAKRGADPRDFTLLPFGGAGPTHANHLADEAGISNISVPWAPGLFCAFGALVSDIKRDFVSSLKLPLISSSALDLQCAFADIKARAEAWLQTDASVARYTQIKLSADMKYAGQAYELNVQLPDSVIADLSIEAVANAFHDVHHLHYGFSDPSARVEIHAARATAIGKMSDISISRTASQRASEKRSDREAWFFGAWQKVQVVDRSGFSVEETIQGPALIEQPDTTIVVLPGWKAFHSDTNTLFLERCNKA
jgi:N-methylhydantoinase A